MSGNKIKKKSSAPWGFIVLMLVIAGLAVYFVTVVLSGDAPRKKDSVTMVTLMKPPPPPPIKEKPPEPEQIKELPKKEEVFTPTPQNIANQDSRPAGEPDNAPEGNNLGVDAEGGAGGDAFGLVGKKGGRSLLAGGGGNGGALGKFSLLSKYSGYTRIAESEIRKAVLKRLDEEGVIQRGKIQAIARVSVDSDGAIVDCKIIGSSGNHKMDDAIQQAVRNMKLSEPPPQGMPQKMLIKFSYQS